MTQDGTLPQALIDGIRVLLEEQCALRMDEVGIVSLVRAIEKAAAQAGMDVPSYAVALQDGRDGGRALQFLVRQVTVGETSFFRHPDDLDWLRNTVLPDIVARREADGTRTIRIWCAGCSTGEEAYTLAALASAAVPSMMTWTVSVLGTDINDNSLATARRATYGPWSFRGVAPATKEYWFESAGTEAWTPIALVRNSARFEYLNLRDPIYPAVFTGTTGLDLVVCRNVFIYFHPERIIEAVTRMQGGLADHGYMLLGPADLLHVKPPAGLLHAERGIPHRLRRVRPSDLETTVEETRPRVRSVRVPWRPRPREAEISPRKESRAATPPTTRITEMLRAGRNAEAVDLVLAELRKDSTSPELYRLLAHGAAACGKDSVALEAWRKLLYLAPSDPSAHLGLALALHRAGGGSEARKHFAAVVSLLEGLDDSATLPGPDAVSVGWARAACRSLATRRRDNR